MTIPRVLLAALVALVAGVVVETARANHHASATPERATTELASAGR